MKSYADEGLILLDFAKSNLKIGTNAKLKYLRVKVINKTGVNISIRPGEASSDLPDQVRRVEVLTYETEAVTSAAPVVTSQFPLSPQVPLPLNTLLVFKALKTNFCGDGIRQSGEFCDDGDKGTCPRDDCGCNVLSNISYSNCSSFSCRGDGAVTSSKIYSGEYCLHDKYQINKNLTGIKITGSLDDILLMVPANSNLSINTSPITPGSDEGMYYGHYTNVHFPSRYLLIAPNYGQIDVSPKYFYGSGNSKVGPCWNYLTNEGEVGTPCRIGDFSAAGFKVYGMNRTIPLSILKAYGLIIKQPDNLYKVNFKFIHYTAGRGHAINIKVEPVIPPEFR